ncbi:MAG: arginine--tRNA ligase [Bacteroidetes bacterium]|mgnify:CR=1 FL=1|nr:arginine--tRNA ligase [Bacteroidota bacterium]
MDLINTIKIASQGAIQALYKVTLPIEDILINATKPEFEGDYTIVFFSISKKLGVSPMQAGETVGNYFTSQRADLFTEFNVIKGFLNLTIHENYWIDFLQKNALSENFGIHPKNNRVVVLEYSSPNTNKPLHLGHLRNIFLGWSLAEILKTCGYTVFKTCVVNNRGIHICKSMIAWKLFANGATPESTHTKGDHFVGEYYVKFNDAYKEQVNSLITSGKNNEEAENEAPIMLQARQMLLDWENGEPEVMELWNKMNSWVYAGFDATYQKTGSDFDKVYYESDTYILGKELVKDGLEKNIFYTKEDGSVWIDLRPDGLDEKIVQRKDGTAVYITQDIGLAVQKFEQFGYEKSIYVVGNEQDYHFKVLKLICERLSLPSSDGIYHLSYGMVELPSGKMKSREGTVVDADDIIQKMEEISQQKTEELGKVSDFNQEELKDLYEMIGMGALKFFLLRIDPKKRMIFNPEESIDFHGFTGPFMQYTYARICSILRKQGTEEEELKNKLPLEKLEKSLIIQAEHFPAILQESADTMDPSKLAIYIFNLARTYNSFYAEHSIANAENNEKKIIRLKISSLTAHIIQMGMKLLGIKVPSKM